MRFKLATWNVNSVRARIDAISGWLDRERPDMLCMQEIKVQDDLFPLEPFAELGYHVAVNGQKTWNGVAVATLVEPDSVRPDLPSGFLSDQKRVISVTVRGLGVTCVYVPNGGEVGHERFTQKLEFLSELRNMASGRMSGAPWILAGDFNVAPGDDDVFDPAELEGTVCFHPEERKRIAAILTDGMKDLYRSFNPSGKAYSWWDYRAAGFRRDRGMRLDLILANPPAARLARDCWIDRDPRSGEKPSDHTPVVAEIDLPPE